MVDSFFRLEIWRVGYELTLQIYRATSSFPSGEIFGLASQLRRASNSVIANIAESQGRYSFQDRIRILYVARAEIFETRSHLKIAEGLGYITPEISSTLDEGYESLVKRLNSFIGHMARKRDESLHSN